MNRLVTLSTLLGAWLLCGAGVAQEFPVRPYMDPSQLDVPWPKMSHYRQPWRGFLETRSGHAFLQGIGVNLHIPNDNEELAVRLLAEAGIRTFRIEVGWGEMSWDEDRLNNEARIVRRFQLCAKYGIRPTILINAHQGVPCPVKFFNRKLVEDAAKGATVVRLDDVRDLVVERSGLNGLSDYWAAEALITAIDVEKCEVTLSKPLPKPLPAGTLPMATLKYSPLHQVESPEFDETSAGWVRHTLHVCRLANDAGVKEFDIELWNELTFGTHFLNVNDYYDKAAPKVFATQSDFLNPGGRCWELARRTVDAVKQEFPKARCIWGFSNTTFYHCPIEKLPPGTDGQSYHPYGTGTRAFDGKPARADQPPLEGFVPRYEIRMPEGWAGTFIQTECLMRLLRPDERVARKPPGTSRFFHYITEHGVLPPECGVTTDDEAWRIKTLCATRSYCFWLNKGVDALHYFVAYDPQATGFGLLPTNVSKLAADAQFDDVATPPLRAVRNLSRIFAASESIEEPVDLSVEVVALGKQTKVFDGDGEHPPLWHRDVLAVLPFQRNANSHVVALYVMTRDITHEFAPAEFRLRIQGVTGNPVTGNPVTGNPVTGNPVTGNPVTGNPVTGNPVTGNPVTGNPVRYYDPITDQVVPVVNRSAASAALDITLPVTDYPRLLIIER